MAEPRRTIETIDFDEIERQIRESVEPRPAPKPSEDPLAELARLVGHRPSQTPYHGDGAGPARKVDPRIDQAFRSLEEFLNTGLPPAASPAQRNAPSHEATTKGEPVRPTSSAGASPDPAPSQPRMAEPEAHPDFTPPMSHEHMAPEHSAATMREAANRAMDEWTIRQTHEEEADTRGKPVDLDEISGRVNLSASVPATAAAAAAAVNYPRTLPGAAPSEEPALQAPPGIPGLGPLPHLQAMPRHDLPKFQDLRVQYNSPIPPVTSAPEHPAVPSAPTHTAPLAEPHMYVEPAMTEPDQQGLEPEAPRRSRKGLFVAASLLGIAAIGVAGALTFRGAKPPLPGTEPPVVRADSKPVRVSPTNPGGIDVPGQDKQVLARSTASPSVPPLPPRVVNTEEQPVDVKTVTREPAKPRVVLPPPPHAVQPATPPSSDTTASVQPSTNPLGEPRRVRTVTIRTGSQSPQPSAPPAPAAAVPIPAPAAAPSVPPTVVAAAPTPSPTPTTTRSVRLPDAVVQPTPPAPSPAQAKPVEPPVETPTISEPPTAKEPPTPAATPTEKPAPKAKQKVVAKPKPAPRRAERPEAPATPAAPATAEPTANQGEGAPIRITPTSAPRRVATAERPSNPTADRGGGSAVQVASATSEAEARAALTSLRARFPELAAHNPSIHKAEVNGQTRWRIRATGMSAEAARGLCSSITSKGGACFVAR